MNVKTEELSLDLRLAAIVTLLSSSALRGMTAGKTAALQHHLEAAVMEAEERDCHAHLMSALQNALQGWRDACVPPVSTAREAHLWPCSNLLH
ncbi:MAG: hypothetical protein LBO79_11005 [Zoogloeaceae bacterium]|jgi:hypothetical protein|nr:hypothetical protein [Zoogloeaceae bacterium]